MTISPQWAIATVLLFVACSNDGPSATVGSAGGSGRPVQRRTIEHSVESAATVKSTAPIPTAPFWPRFHGPDGYNMSAETGLLKQWPEGGPPLVWTAEGIGHGFSGVALSGGLIYTDGNVADETVVTALDLNGQIVWQTPNGAAWTKSHAGTRGTPTCDDGHVYHESPLGHVMCLDGLSGAEIWRVNILDRFDGKNIRWGLAESLLIDGNHLICCPGGKQASVVALDKRTGEVVWTARGTGDVAGYASPALAECQGLRMILTMNARALIGVRAEDGELLFEFPHVTEYDVNALMPLYHDGHVFISSGYGSGSALVKIAVVGKEATVEQVWESEDLDNHHGGVILLDGCIHGAASAQNNAKWICLDWKTGAMQYAERGVGKGSLTYADGMFYMLSEKRRMGLVKASAAGHEVISQFTVPSGGEAPSWAHPVVCGGRLYLRHSDKLYAYDVRAEEGESTGIPRP